MDLSAQQDRIGNQLFTALDGLSQSHITVVYQDRIGFLWIGTRDGLNKYDGYNFYTYRNQPFNKNSISNNYIRSIAEDSRGNIWIGSNSGLNMLDRKTGAFKVFLPLNPDSSLVGDPVVFSVYIDKEDKVWFKTNDCLEVMDIDSGTIKVYNHFYDRFGQVPVDQIYNICEDRNGRIWISTKDGLQMFNRQTEEIRRYTRNSPAQKNTGSETINTVYEDSRGNLWIGTEEGLFLFDHSKKSFEKIPVKGNNDIQHRKIIAISEDADGMLWIGTDMGFFQMSAERNIVGSFSGVEVRNEVHQISAVYSIREDRTEIIWLGTFEGLVKIDRKRKKFTILDNSDDGVPGMTSNIISAIYKDDQHHLWVGTWGSGLNVIDLTDNSVTIYSEDQKNRNQKISNDYIHSIYCDSKKRIWIGTSDGVNCFDEVSGRFRRLCENNPNISCNIFNNNSVNDILEDRSGNIWFATGNGVHKYIEKHNEIRSYYMIFSGEVTFDLKLVYCLLEDQDGMIWIGTENGLIRYNPDEDIFNIYRTGNTDDSGLISHIIYSLYLDSQSVLWAGTASGLNRYDRINNKFTFYPKSEALIDDQVFAIQEDQDSRLWMSTNRGLIRFDPSSENYLTFNLSDGLQNYEFIRGSSFKSSSGELFFGGISGLNYFHPDSIYFNEYIPNITFTNFEIDGELGRTSLPLERTLAIEVMKGNRIFTIGFSALDFTSPENNRYIYKMVKQNSQGSWIQIGKQHYVTFYNLSPGSYIFSVKGSNNDNVWNEEGVSIEVDVPPPFWSSWKAYSIYIIASIVLVYLLIQFYTRNLRQANKILKEKETAAKLVEKHREELILKNKNITDSITYAKRIQMALLPSTEMFKKILPDSFILFKPKDIVSGDFYWITEEKNKIFVAAVDCTGHGVPGAFVSILGFELFRKITSEKGIKSPAKILDSLNLNFADIFSDGEHVYLQDGMDLTLCVLDRNEKILEYAGAFNPLYLIRNETIIEVKANRLSIGAEVYTVSENREFKSHQIRLQKDDIFYMFSDGYSDQFGGPEGKKFKYRRFRHLLLTIHKIPLEKQLAILDASIEEWMADHEQIDDIMVIGIKPDFWKDS
jgi:ligand-binding sensor domain-containing protein/serine phosphatase RsbU (regulator of sigma subunit)